MWFPKMFIYTGVTAQMCKTIHSWPPHLFYLLLHWLTARCLAQQCQISKALKQNLSHRASAHFNSTLLDFKLNSGLVFLYFKHSIVV